MRKQAGLRLSNEALERLRGIVQQANDGFKYGRISQSIVINQMILESKINVEQLRASHINIKTALRSLLKESDADIEEALKKLEILKNKAKKSTQKSKG